MEITDFEFELFSTFVKNEIGVKLKEHNRALIIFRLSKRLESLNLNTFHQYYEYLKNDKQGKELHYFVDKITTHYTFFQREQIQFDFLQEVVLPQLYDTIEDGDLRIWSAATSSGEEAYTLAMVLDEFFIDKENWDKTLLATDISREAIAKARSGIYSEAQILNLPKTWKLKYFEKCGDKFRVKKMLKDEIIFRCFNLLDYYYPFNRKFHVIFCKNVLIYFDKDSKKRVLTKLIESLNVGGYLFLGLSESINYSEYGLKYVRPSVYYKGE